MSPSSALGIVNFIILAVSCHVLIYSSLITSVDWHFILLFISCLYFIFPELFVYVPSPRSDLVVCF